MPSLLCEIWEDPDNHSYEMGVVDERSDQLRAVTSPKAVLRHRFFATSRFEAFQKNYDWHGWGQWKSEPEWPDVYFTEEDLLAQQRYLGVRPDHRPAPAFAIKAEIADATAETFVFPAQKTMYGGKSIAMGDTIYVFASENEGGQGLIARGVIGSVEALAKPANVERWTPRVNVTVWSAALAKRPLGRRELRPFKDWSDGRPETELNFKFYRQATNKIIGVSEAAAVFLDGFF